MRRERQGEEEVKRRKKVFPNLKALNNDFDLTLRDASVHLTTGLRFSTSSSMFY